MLKELTQEEEQELEMMCPETVYGMEDNIATEVYIFDVDLYNNIHHVWTF